MRNRIRRWYGVWINYDEIALVHPNWYPQKGQAVIIGRQLYEVRKFDLKGWRIRVRLWV